MWALALVSLGPGCSFRDQTMSTDERDARLHKLFALPCDNTWCGGLWRFDDAERGITCYIASGKHDLISCVHAGGRELEPTPAPRRVQQRPRPMAMQ